MSMSRNFENFPPIRTASNGTLSCESFMTSIGGPGGIGGPKGPSGPAAPDAPDASAGADEVAEPTGAAAAAKAGEFDAIAADIAAGKLTPQQAVDRIVDEIAGSDALGAADRAELRELLADLVANDPYLAALVGRV